jgi:hypothetical protein
MLVGAVASGAANATSRVGLQIIKEIRDAAGIAAVLIGPQGPIAKLADAERIPYRLTRDPKFASGSFRDRVIAARCELEGLKASTVYATSAACSPWAVAAAQIGVKVILHVREFDDELMSLLKTGATCIDVCSAADVVIVSGGEVESSIRRCLGYVPHNVTDVGVLLDGAWIIEQAGHSAAARWLHGRPYLQSDRQLVVMQGIASSSNGVDIFAEMARQLPAYDFVWIGPWSEHADQELSRRGLSAASLANFYCTGEIDNPYPIVADSDLFALTARRAENPLDIIELAALNVKIICFSRSMEAWKDLPRAFYILEGVPSVDRLTRAVSLILGEKRKARHPHFPSFPTVSAQPGFRTLLNHLPTQALLPGNRV